MTTTDNWQEARKDGTAHIDRSQRWLLVWLDGPPYGISAGWHLFGPSTNGMLVSVPDDGPLALLLASRVADRHIEAQEAL